MKAAWRRARQGQRIYGGHVWQYIREALKIVWAELKTDPVNQACNQIIADLRADLRAGCYEPTVAPTLYLARFMNRRSAYRPVWGNSYL